MLTDFNFPFLADGTEVLVVEGDVVVRRLSVNVRNTMFPWLGVEFLTHLVDPEDTDAVPRLWVRGRTLGALH